MKRILITAPARQDPKIFDEYREGIANLIIPDGYEISTFYVVNNCPELIPHLRPSDNYCVQDTTEQYIKTDNDHIWTTQNTMKVGLLRNMTIEYALHFGFDYWFSVDTDVVLHPDTLRTLIEADKNIVSEIFWSVDKYGNKWCNAWMYDRYSGVKPEWQHPGLYQCGMTGACTLVKRKVLEAGVNYSFVPNLTMWGEDRHFCIRAAVHGFELWIDTHYPATHLYTETEYINYMKRKGAENHG